MRCLDAWTLARSGGGAARAPNRATRIARSGACRARPHRLMPQGSHSRPSVLSVQTGQPASRGGSVDLFVRTRSIFRDRPLSQMGADMLARARASLRRRPFAGPGGHLQARIKAILLAPRTEWPLIAQEHSDIAELYLRYIMPLAAIPPLCKLIGWSLLFSYMGFGIGLVGALASYALGLAGVALLALIASRLAAMFEGEQDIVQAFKLVAYASTPGWDRRRASPGARPRRAEHADVALRHLPDLYRRAGGDGGARGSHDRLHRRGGRRRDPRLRRHGDDHHRARRGQDDRHGVERRRIGSQSREAGLRASLAPAPFRAAGGG